MADVVSPEVRSRMMSGIRGKDTKPEITIRSGLHALGFRFRLHVKNLPGKPDLVLPKWNAVILINGCFWHGHDCHLFKWPKTRKKFWKDKIEGTRKRDERNAQALEDAGWRVLTIWECATKGKNKKDLARLLKSVSSWLQSGKKKLEIGHAGGMNSGKERIS